MEVFNLFNSDHAEFLHPRVTVTAVTIQVSPPICGESFVPSLGLRAHPFLLESSYKEYLGGQLGIKSPQRHFPAFSWQSLQSFPCKPVWDQSPEIESP